MALGEERKRNFIEQFNSSTERMSQAIGGGSRKGKEANRMTVDGA